MTAWAITKSGGILGAGRALVLMTLLLASMLATVKGLTAYLFAVLLLLATDGFVLFFSAEARLLDLHVTGRARTFVTGILALVSHAVQQLSAGVAALEL